MSADYGTRAAMALNEALPGRHRDKRAALRLGVSLRTAKYLRAGKHWTIDRLSQARAEFGAVFDVILSDSKPENFAERMARLEERLDAVVLGTADAAMAPSASAAVCGGGGAVEGPPVALPGAGTGAAGGAAGPEMGTEAAHAAVTERRHIKDAVE